MRLTSLLLLIRLGYCFVANHKFHYQRYSPSIVDKFVGSHSSDHAMANVRSNALDPHEAVARIKSLANSEWPHALSLLDQLEDSSNVFALCAAVAVCGRGGQWQIALELLDRTNDPDVPLYHAALGALAKARRGSEAELLLFDRMKEAKLPIDSYSLNEVVAAYRGDWKEAVRVMDAGTKWRLESGGECPKVGTFIAVIRACIDGEAFYEAMEWLLVAREATQKFLVHDKPKTTLACAVESDMSALTALEQSLWRTWSKYELDRVENVISLSFIPLDSQKTMQTSKLGALEFPEFSRLAPVDRLATKNLFDALGTSADEGFMPNFDNAGARSGYLLQKFTARSSRAADFLVAMDAMSLQSHGETKLLLQGVVGDVLLAPSRTRVLSLGGGPGMDAMAVTLLANYQRLGGREGGVGIDAMILDYEAQWHDCVKVVGNAIHTANSARRIAQPKDQLQQKTEVQFGLCDITVSLDESINLKANEYLESAQPLIVICSYVIAENAIALREGKYHFFVDLAHAVPVGSVLLFTETTHRVWPDLLRASFCGVDKDETLLQDFDVFIPTITGKHGVAIGLHKVLRSQKVQPQPLAGDLTSWLESRVGDEANVKFLRDFERDNKFHEKRLERQKMDLQQKQAAEEARINARNDRLETLRARRNG